MSLASLPHDPTAAYAAGLIDGEGHIGIQESKNKSTSYFYVEVTVGMSDKARPILEALHEEFGGTVNHGRKESEKWAASMKWRIGGESAIAFLQRVQPFLMLKREQATTALELGKIVATLPVVKERKTWTAKARKKAAALKKEMHKLNQKGPDAQNAGAGWYKPQQTLFGTLEKFSGAWPKAGMTVDGVCYQQPSWERPIYAKESGLWPTPKALDAFGIETSQKNYDKYRSGMTLTQAVRQSAMLPTPRANKIGGYSSERFRPTLEQVVRRYPTPPAGSDTLVGGTGHWQMLQATSTTNLVAS